jgi:hypothetical protein
LLRDAVQVTQVLDVELAGLIGPERLAIFRESLGKIAAADDAG